MIDSKTKELLAKGRAKMDARLAIVEKYLKEIKHKALQKKAISKDIVKTGKAKKKAREEIVQNYLSGIHS